MSDGCLLAVGFCLGSGLARISTSSNTLTGLGYTEVTGSVSLGS